MKRYAILFLLLMPLPGVAQKIDSLQNLLQNNNQDNAQKVDVLNALGYEYWIKEPEKSVGFGQQAQKIAEEIDYQKGLAYAHRVEGVAQWALAEPKLALENLTVALELYEKLEDEEGISNSKLNIGMVYADIDEDKRALQLFDEAITGFTALNLQGRIATTFTKIGSVYLKKQQFDDALNYLTSSLKIHSANNYKYGMAEAHNRLGTLHILKGDLEQADYHIRQSLIIGRQINDEDGLISNMIQFGKILRLRGEYDNSEVHLRFALNKSREKSLNNYKLAALEELKNLKSNQGQLDSALFYSDKYSQLKDSIYSTQKSRQIAAIEFGNKIEEQDRELAFLSEKEENSTRMKWILISGICIIILLGFFLIRSLRQRNKNQQELLKKQELITRQEREYQRLKHRELEKELEFKNKELTSYALYFVQKNQLLESLKAKLDDIKTASRDPQQKRKLIDIERIIKQQGSAEKEWEDFRLHFEKVHSGFFKKLKREYPSLSSNDLKIASLSRLNLSTKEMAGVLGISPESVKTARYRFRKKVNISADEELFEFLLRIEP